MSKTDTIYLAIGLELWVDFLFCSVLLTLTRTRGLMTRRLGHKTLLGRLQWHVCSNQIISMSLF